MRDRQLAVGEAEGLLANCPQHDGNHSLRLLKLLHVTDPLVKGSQRPQTKPGLLFDRNPMEMNQTRPRSNAASSTLNTEDSLVKAASVHRRGDWPNAPSRRWLRRLAAIMIVCGLPGIISSSIFADDTLFDRDSLMFHQTLRLKSGEVLEGTLIEEKVVDRRDVVVFETIDGDRLTIDLGKLVDGKGVRKLNNAANRYNTAVATMEDTAAAHHDMVTWCTLQEKGDTLFKTQIQFHRKRIMALDPNDEKVRKQLEYRYVEEQSRWVLEKQYWKSLGYEGTHWIPRLQQSMLDEKDEAKKNPPESIRAFSSWLRKVKSMSPSQAQSQLLQIADIELMPRLLEEIQEEKNFNIREVYAEAMAKFPCYASAQGLVYAFMEGGSDRAIDLLLQDGFDRATSAQLLVKYLAQRKSNYQIQRAGYALGELDHPGVILALTNALLTEHVIRKAGDPGRINTGFNNQGAGGLQMGGGGKDEKGRFKNDQVLNALKKITEQDFDQRDYDKTVWQEWFLDNYTHRYLSPRR